MKRTYWEKIAPAYNDEIFDVLHNDKKAIIRSAINKLSSKSKTVIDIGCAIGKWLPVLSPAFKKVYAVDISAKNLEIAKKNYPQYKNVMYQRADMSNSKTKLPVCDFAICINAILTSSLNDRILFFKSLSGCLKKRGHVVLVVPSLESYLFTSIVSNQWKIDRAVLGKKTTAQQALQKWNNIKQGNADIDDVPTKHYLKEELSLLLNREGFVIEDFQKIEYNWKTEFLRPPKWLHEPMPWDWMVIAKKS
ncbi:MAG: class I SAM-dependent methyltransferase [Bacteroidia bacterium]|nr:class I SAM-dependent methyltransferase [Bacteroidia bacterium]